MKTGIVRDEDHSLLRKMWHNLQQVLASPFPSENVVTGRSLESFVEEDEGNPILLQFDGSAVRAKVALACNGSFSTARRLLLGKLTVLLLW